MPEDFLIILINSIFIVLYFLFTRDLAARKYVQE